jgi:HEAT repeat protein
MAIWAADCRTTAYKMVEDQGDMPTVGAFSTDLSFVITGWDKALESMTCIAAKDAVGRNVFELIPDLLTRGVFARFERVRDLGTTEILSPALHGFVIDCPTQVPSSHFEKMQQLVTISGLSSDEGNRNGIHIIIEDVTERLSHERDLASRLSDPDENVRMAAAKDFSANSSRASGGATRAAIGALGDKNWRIRRKLVEGLSSQLTPEAAETLLKAVGEDHLDFGLLNSAVQILQNSSVDTTDTLIEFLHSPDSDLRVQAALMLGQQKNTAAVPELIRVLQDEGEDGNVRAHAIEALGEIGADEAVDALLSVVKKRDFFLTFAALMALKMIGAQGISDEIVPLLADTDLREAVAEALASVGDIEAVTPIVNLLNNGELPATQAAASLAAIKEKYSESADDIVRDAVRSSIDSNGTAALAQALGSPKRDLLSPVIAVAGWISNAALAERLARLMDNDDLRDDVVESMAAQGDAAIPYFAEHLRSGESDIQKAAARGLAQVASSEAVNELISALDDTETAPFAVEALGRSTDPAVTRTLISRLSETEDPKERAALVRILGKSSSDDCRARILAACDDPESTVRIAALEQLPRFNAEAAADRLKHALRDASPQVRAVAARVLGNIGGSRAAAVLRSALKDDDAWTRYFAVRSLGALKDFESLEQIRNLSENDAAEQVRVAAAEVLAGESKI